MQQVLSGNLWTEIRRRARRAKSRKAAIAYVTQDLIGLRKGDTLIVDASVRAIQNGETDARLLRRLKNRGVVLYGCVDLHAKVILIDDVAIVSSGNMSSSSMNRMVEAAVMSDNGSVVSGVASLIEQLVKLSSLLTDDRIAALCKLKVIRRGGRGAGRGRKRSANIAALGNRTWIVGVRELKHGPTKDEQRRIDSVTNSLMKRLDLEEEELGWIKWGIRGRFVRECQPGDSLIQVWRTSGAKRPSVALKPVPVLLRQLDERWTRYYVREPVGRASSMSWGRFQRLLAHVGYPRRVGPNAEQLVEPDMADAIARKWNSAARL